MLHLSGNKDFEQTGEYYLEVVTTGFMVDVTDTLINTYTTEYCNLRACTEG